MVKNIWHDGPGIHVQHSQSEPRFNMHQQDAGRVRYNGDTASLEVYNGFSWVQWQSTAMIGLNHDYISAVEWAKTKMIDEQRIRELAKKHPAVADAVEAVKQAEEQLQIVTALVDVK
jgi:hypothetical protein